MVMTANGEEYVFHSFRRYDFKLTLSQREIFKKIQGGFSWRSVRLLVNFLGGRGPSNFRCCARVWFAHFRHSLLRADRDSSATDAKEWPTPLQRQRAFSSS